MAKISSGLNFTSEYFIRNFYSNNRDAGNKSTRSRFSNVELTYEDSRALSRAAKRMKRGDYTTSDTAENDDISETTKSSIEAFVNTYNNMLDSGRESDDYDTKRYVKQLKALSQKYSDELENIGITVENDGKLSVNSDLLAVADYSSVSSLFSQEQEFVQKTQRIASRLNEAAYNDIFTQISTKNVHINITV